MELPKAFVEDGVVVTPHGMGLAGDLVPDPGAGSARWPRLLSASDMEDALSRCAGLISQPARVRGAIERGGTGGVSAERIMLHLFAQGEIIPAIRASDGLGAQRTRAPRIPCGGLSLAGTLRAIGCPEGYEVRGRRIHGLRAARIGDPAIIRMGSGRYVRYKGRGLTLRLRSKLRSMLIAARARHRAAIRQIIRAGVCLETLGGEQMLHQGRSITVWLHQENVLSLRHSLRPWSIKAEGTTKRFAATELRVAILMNGTEPICPGLVTTHPHLDHMFVSSSGAVCLANYMPRDESVVRRAMALLTRAKGVLRVPRNATGVGGYKRIQSVTDSAQAHEVCS